MKFEIEVDRERLVEFRRILQDIETSLVDDDASEEEMLREFFFFEYFSDTFDIRNEVKITKIK